MKGFRAENFTLDYVRDYIGGVEHYRPRISVRLQHGDKKFHTDMVVDSGADVCLIPAQVADVLELKLGESTTSIGPAGKFSVRPAEVELYIYPDREPIPLGVVPVTVPETSNISEGADLVELCLLGRRPFFECYDITFQESKRRVTFRPASKLPPKFPPPPKKSQQT